MWGKKHSAETRLKMRLFRLGKPRKGNPDSWKLSDETKRKIGDSNKGKRKGYKFTKEWKQHISESHKGMIGKRHSEKTKQLFSLLRKGSKHPNWKGGITPENLRIRNSKEYAEWKKKVFERDNFTCIWCRDNKGGNLEADHIKKFSEYPELRFEVSNGRTLCVECHRKTHNYGKRKQKKGISFRLFRIKEGKKQQWIDWCTYLATHPEDVRHTLVQENSTREACFTYGDYVVGYAEFHDAPIPADMDNPLNVDHRRHLKECLEKVEGAPLYDISV